MWRSYFLVTILALTISFFILLQPQASKNNPLTDSLARRRLLYQQYPMLHKFLKGNQPYKAPFHLCELESRVPDSYFVFLHFGYDLETHQTVVGNGIDLNDAIKSVAEENERHGVRYRAELDDEDLTAIRADIGVDMVECELYAELIAGRVDWVAPEGADIASHVDEEEEED